jgi:hypothetical protein
MKGDVAEIKQLLNVFRLKRRDSSDDSDKPARYGIDTEDDVSERSEVRDDDYVGTDLYWENRFYNVRPFKQVNSDEEDPEDYVEKKN